MTVPSDPSRLYDLLERERAENTRLREALTASTELLLECMPLAHASWRKRSRIDFQIRENQSVLGLAEPEGERA